MSLILIVEDDILLRETLTLLLRRESFSTMEAASAIEALNLTNQHLFDAAIVDQGLPDMAGDELAFTMRNSGIPCILFTGMDEEDASLAAARAGAVSYLVKPVDVPTLFSAVRSALSTCPASVDRKACQ